MQFNNTLKIYSRGFTYVHSKRLCYIFFMNLSFQKKKAAAVELKVVVLHFSDVEGKLIKESWYFENFIFFNFPFNLCYTCIWIKSWTHDIGFLCGREFIIFVIFLHYN